VLIAGHAHAGREGGRLVIVRPQPDSPVAKIIEVSGLDGELHFVDEAS
jgi:anti-anti-sigma regulatory factor